MEWLKKLNLPILSGLGSESLTKSGAAVLGGAWAVVLTLEMPAWIKGVLVVASACVWNLAGVWRTKE